MRITFELEPKKNRTVIFMWGKCPYCGETTHLLCFVDVVSFVGGKIYINIHDVILRDFETVKDSSNCYLVLKKCEHFQKIKYEQILFLSPDLPKREEVHE